MVGRTPMMSGRSTSELFLTNTVQERFSCLLWYRRLRRKCLKTRGDSLFPVLSRLYSDSLFDRGSSDIHGKLRSAKVVADWLALGCLLALICCQSELLLLLLLFAWGEPSIAVMAVEGVRLRGAEPEESMDLTCVRHKSRACRVA